MPKTKLVHIRELLQAHLDRQVGRDLPTTPQLIQSFRKKHSRQIKLCSPDLEDVALAKIIAQVSNRRRKANPVMADLFGEHPGIPQFISVPIEFDGQSRLHRKRFVDSSIDEVRAWLDYGSAGRRSRREAYPGVVAAVADVVPYATGRTTMAKAGQARRKAQAAEQLALKL